MTTGSDPGRARTSPTRNPGIRPRIRRNRRPTLGDSRLELRDLPAAPAVVAPVARIAAGAPPLDDPGRPFQGEITGLYGPGTNAVPTGQAALASTASRAIRPLDRSGRPSPSGRIGLIAIGPSTLLYPFAQFQSMMRREPRVSPSVALVNAGQDGLPAEVWSATVGGPWSEARKRVAAAGLTPAQVQVAWISMPAIFGHRYGDFASFEGRYAELLAGIVRTARAQYPNLKIAYVSSQNYSGYAGPNRAITEPYAYEMGYGVRRLIRRQVDGDPTLNADPASGRERAPVLLWGPYLWSDGATPRKSDGLAWLPRDFKPDGVHPVGPGAVKIASRLRDFLLTDPTAKGWFARRAATPTSPATRFSRLDRHLSSPVT